MMPDPAIDEVRAVRHLISAEHGHDTGRLLDHYRQFEALHGERILRRRVEQVIEKSPENAPGEDSEDR
jgi:hypothetical protein